MKKVIFVLFMFCFTLLVTSVNASNQVGIISASTAPKPPAQVVQAANKYATIDLQLTIYELVYEKNQNVWTVYVYNGSRIPTEGGEPEPPVGQADFKSNGKRL